MDSKFANRIIEEIERFKNALLHYAKQCEWEIIKSKAGALFDYLETIELSEIQWKFIRMFRLLGTWRRISGRSLFNPRAAYDNFRTA